MIVSPMQLRAIQNEFAAFDRAARSRVLRPISQFACEEIVCPPGGPHENQRFNLNRQPWAKLWFNLIESGKFCRYAATGCVQNGKTLTCYVIPAMYHLFEIGENVGCGIPQMEMAWDKWTRDFLPVIKASKYVDLIPDTGPGSKGGKFEGITFKNGATLKFISGKGDDAKRSGITFRVLVMTEVDRYDEASGASREDSPVAQMIARLDAFQTLNSVVYMECTVTTETGCIWVEITNGSCSRIVLQCPHCDLWVTPEREHLIGWQQATNEIDARDGAKFACPECGLDWTEEQRRTANENAKLVHKGQEITPEGEIVGPIPKTLTAGFRWNAANNLLKTAADFGGKEFNARKSPEENENKSITQFMWSKPTKSEIQDQMPLNFVKLLDRVHPYDRGVVPPDCDSITLGLDLGKWFCHWTAIAWGSRARGYIIDHGRIAVASATIGIEAGLMEAMREVRTLSSKGWTRTDTQIIVPDENLIDSGWKTTIAYAFIQETGLPFRATKGLSVGGEVVTYTRPKSTGAIVKHIGEGWHIAKLAEDRIMLLEIDADWAKTTLHARLNCEPDAPGAITMFQIDRTNLEANEDRRRFVRNLTAEKSTEEFVRGRGTVTRWAKIRADNHYLDSTALGLVGGSINGISVAQFASTEKPAIAPVPAEPAATVIEVQAKQVVSTVSEAADDVRETGSSFSVRPMTPRSTSGWARRRS